MTNDDCLNNRERGLIALRLEEGETYQHIAERFNISPERVRTLLLRALEKLYKANLETKHL